MTLSSIYLHWAMAVPSLKLYSVIFWICSGPRDVSHCLGPTRDVPWLRCLVYAWPLLASFCDWTRSQVAWHQVKSSRIDHRGCFVNLPFSLLRPPSLSIGLLCQVSAVRFFTPDTEWCPSPRAFIRAHCPLPAPSHHVRSSSTSLEPNH